MIRKALTLAMTVAVAVLVGALGVMPTAAQQAGVSASRSFERETVAADAQDRRVEVTIVVSGPVGFADVVETLPDGFNYVDEPVSSDSTINVGQDGQDVTFTFNGATSFTYAVTAPSARRSFDPASVAAGVPVVVTITVTGAGRGVVTETLQSGMEYEPESSSLPSGKVRLVGQDIHFILAESADSPFTYTVTASQTGSISGELTVDRVPYDVLGVSRVTVEADSAAPSARRSFDPAPVAAGVPVVVTITVSGTARGVATETLPSGMEYEPESSSLPSGQVRLVGQDIHFILAESADSPFTYTVTASQTGSISGELTVDRVPYDVLGVSRVTVRTRATTTPTGGDGGGGGGGIAAPPAGTVAAGATVRSPAPSETVPAQARVRTPNAGVVRITIAPEQATPPLQGFNAVGTEPSLANSWAMARPSPLLASVTIATIS